MNHVPLKKEKKEVKKKAHGLGFFKTYTLKTSILTFLALRKILSPPQLGKELKTMKFDIPQEISFLGLTKITDANMREHFFL